MVAETVIQWLDKHFPKPRVDLEWLNECAQWLEEDQRISPDISFAEFMERVKGQLLESDLVDSMWHGTGLDINTPKMTGLLRGPPVLVQITAITEIGISAGQLEQIRVSREERMAAGVGNQEGDEDGDVEVEGEGPMPKYPRGTLFFRLSDGHTDIEAMEYRTISQFTLGTTPLGFKLQLTGTRIHKGMAMLEPGTINLLGGKQAEMEARQAQDFKNSLRVRLNRPPSPEREAEATMAVERPTTAEAAIRSPLREISLPSAPDFPQHEDDIEMEPRRRIPPTSSLYLQQQTKDDEISRPIVGLPSRRKTSLGGTSKMSDGEEGRLIPKAERATLIGYASSIAPQRSTTSMYFKGNSNATSSSSASSSKVNMAIQNLDFNFEPTWRQVNRTLPSSPPDNGSNSFGSNLLDEVDQENQPPPPFPALNLNTKGKGREIRREPSSDDYGMEVDYFEDPDFLENLDRVEQEALHRGTSVSSAANGTNPQSSGFASTPNSNSTFGLTLDILTKNNNVDDSPRAGSAQTAPPLPSTRTRIISGDIIEIDDSDDEILGPEDKENAPVPTRHVKPRIEPSAAKENENKGPSISQRNRSVILTTYPGDIIDLSD